MMGIPIIKEATITIADGTSFYIPTRSRKYIIQLHNKFKRKNKYIPDLMELGSLLAQNIIVIALGGDYQLTAIGNQIYNVIKERAMQRKIHDDFVKAHPDVEANISHCTITALLRGKR